jgi:hypothetical protein
MGVVGVPVAFINVTMHPRLHAAVEGGKLFGYL